MISILEFQILQESIEFHYGGIEESQQASTLHWIFATVLF